MTSELQTDGRYISLFYEAPRPPDLCRDCGALIGDRLIHDRFHGGGAREASAGAPHPAMLRMPGTGALA